MLYAPINVKCELGWGIGERQGLREGFTVRHTYVNENALFALLPISTHSEHFSNHILF